MASPAKNVTILVFRLVLGTGTTEPFQKNHLFSAVVSAIRLAAWRSFTRHLPGAGARPPMGFSGLIKLSLCLAAAPSLGAAKPVDVDERFDS